MGKNRYLYGKRIWAVVAIAAVLFGIGSFHQAAQAAQTTADKSIKKVTVKVGSKTVNGKTTSMKKGKTAKIKVSTSPKLTKKTITYKSSKPSVVTVNKSGKLTAKKAGTSTISVRVKAEGYQTKKVTFKVKVAKDNAAADSSTGTTDTTENTDTNGAANKTNKTLVAYFSATNTTKGIAETIAEATGAEVYEIKPGDPYTSADLDYNNDFCRANQEQQNSSSRPAIDGSVANFNDYEVIYLGFPIWWGEEPRIIDTFLESYDFSGKTIVPFCTSGGSGIGTAVSNIKDKATGSPEVKEGRRFNGSVSKTTVEEWIEGLGLGK